MEKLLTGASSTMSMTMITASSFPPGISPRAKLFVQQNHPRQRTLTLACTHLGRSMGAVVSGSVGQNRMTTISLSRSALCIKGQMLKSHDITLLFKICFRMRWGQRAEAKWCHDSVVQCALARRAALEAK